MEILIFIVSTLVSTLACAVRVDSPPIIVGICPVLGKGVAGSDGQGGAVASDRSFDVLCPLSPDAVWVDSPEMMG